MKKIRRLGCCPFGSGAQILLKFKLLSVVLLSAFASIAADGYSQRTKPEQVMNPVEQQKKISGKVVDSQGLPVPGATIIVNGT